MFVEANDRFPRVKQHRSGVAGLVALLLITSCNINPSSGGSSRKKVPPKVGGSIVVATGEPDSLDPARASNGPALLILKQVCDSLVSYDPLTGKLGPGLAESWSISPDAKQFTFRLKKGIKFHNGRQIEAQDFVNSMSRFASAHDGSPQHFFFEKVVGYLDLRTDKAPQLAGVKAIAPDVLEIDTSEPFAELPAIMSHPAAGTVVPKEEVDKGAAFGAAPSCSGPYLIAKPWAKGQDLTLTRNTTYLGNQPAMTRHGRGYADSIVFKFADAEGAFKLLASKKANVADVPVNDLARARRGGIKVQSAPNGFFSYIGLPVNRPPFDNKSFRSALDLALDREEVIEDLLAGTRGFARGMVPPTAGPVSALSQCTKSVAEKPDVKGAKAALKASKVDPDQVTMTVHLNTGGGHERWLTPVMNGWKQRLGVGSVLKPDEWKVFLDSLVDPGPDGPYRLAWSVRYPSPEAVLDPLFTTGSLDNFSRYSNPAFDDKIKKARATPDDDARASAYAEAAAMLCDDLPILPMWFGEDHVGFAANITSATNKPTDIFGDPVLREVGKRS